MNAAAAAYKRLDGVSGEIRATGLINGGKITPVTINDSTWTEIPPNSLDDRNSFVIYNLSGQECKWAFSDSPGNEWLPMVTDERLVMDIKDTQANKIYMQSTTGNVEIKVLELA